MDNKESPAINIRRRTVNPPTAPTPTLTSQGKQSTDDISRVIRMSKLKMPTGKVSTTSGIVRAPMTGTMKKLSKMMMKGSPNYGQR